MTATTCERQPLRVSVVANVRAEMTRRGETVASLALGADMSLYAMRRRLSGQVPFDIDELDAIARRLRVPMTVLVRRSAR